MDKWIINKKERKGRLLAIDGAEYPLITKGDCRSSKYKVRQKSYKLHTLVDTDTEELVDYRVTSDKVRDNSTFLSIVKGATKKGDIVYLDGAYDSRNNFDYLIKME